VELDVSLLTELTEGKVMIPPSWSIVLCCR